MAIGWLTILKSVPWVDVVSNAPKVADGAKKLWKAIAKQPPAADAATAVEQPALSPDAQSVAEFQRRLTAAEAAAADLHAQMLASSELIKTLAEQNTQLIRHMEHYRIRTLWLTAATIIIGIVAVSSLVATWAR
ncbi:MAG: hypothetical protein D4S02_11705 [Rhodocyclaceae bacterium]|nr:MAG: hypothetical protein D4S02_11705 [Rhodocyclaceae bacterium]